MAELDDGIVSAIANEEMKAIASFPAQLGNQLAANMVNSHHTRQSFIDKSMGNTLAAMDRIGMTEAIAVGGLQSKEVASLMMTLISAIGGSQQAVKTAQSTPPETGS